jgi:hypothetical protein
MKIGRAEGKSELGEGLAPAIQLRQNRVDQRAFHIENISACARDWSDSGSFWEMADDFRTGFFWSGFLSGFPCGVHPSAAAHPACNWHDNLIITLPPVLFRSTGLHKRARTRSPSGQIGLR